jgi:hypothetical protein
MIQKLSNLFFKEQKHRDLAIMLSLCSSLFALTFQITVLHPWHLQLSNEFDKLSKQIIDKK